VQISLVVDDGRCRFAVMCAHIDLPAGGDGADHKQSRWADAQNTDVLMTLFHALVNR
jgi:hypothetical protein